MKIDPNDPRPPYRQLADDLRKRISAGEFPPGTRLPSIRLLADEYGISPQTVQNALRELRNDGLVVAQQGRAFFVRDPGRAVAGVDGDTGERLAAVEADLRDLRDNDSQLREQITALRIQIMDLYARIGGAAPPGEGPPER